MGANRVPQTWRLVQLHQPFRPCAYCGEEHEYLTRRPTRGRLCQPLLFPPGISAATSKGIEVDVIEGLDIDRGDAEEAARYRALTRRVADAAIRCERCGERFDALDAYLLHDCTIHYR